MAINLNGVTREGSRHTLKILAAEAASSTHALARTGMAGTLVVEVEVTAASGTTPTLTLVVEGSVDGQTWFEIGRLGADGARVGTVGTAPTNFTGAGSASGAFPAPPFVRTRSIVGGTTPSFTYSVEADLS